MALDFSVSARQAFGSSVPQAAVEKLLAGKLVMSPHPEWELPARIDWSADPFKDVNWRSQFHMLRWLDPLRRAAAKGDEAAYEMWIRYVRDWVQSNPRHRPAHEWVWSDMVDGIRAIQLCLGAPLVRDHSAEDLAWLEQTIRDHAQHLADPANLGHSNHAMHQHEALFVCGRILQDEAFTQLATDRFNKLLAEQYDDQGINAEGAIAYHYNNYLWYERVLRRFDAEGVPRPAAAARLALAPEAIAHATRPDGTFVGIGDTDGGTPKAIGSSFTDYVSSGGAEGEAPPDLIKIYDRGYLFARSGWGETERNYDEETFFSARFGPSRTVHGHPDGGSLTFTAETVNWIVDPGKFQYGNSIPRRHVLQRSSHSLVSLEGVQARKEATVKLVRETRTSRSLDVLFSDDSFPGVDLTRRVIYSVTGDYLVVIDQVRSPRPVTAHQRWQLGPDVTARITPNRVELAGDDRQAVIAFAGTAAELSEITGSKDPFDGWVATGWKRKVPATAITATKSGDRFRFITVLAAGSGQVPTVRTIPLEEAGVCLEVATGRVTEQILIGAESVSFPDDALDDDDDGSHASGPITGTAAADAPPRHLDPEVRAEMFSLITRVRNAGVSGSDTDRRTAAEELLTKGRALGLTVEADLGLTAAVTDLRQTVRGRIDPSKIQSQRTALVNWDQDPGWQPTFYPLPLRHHGYRFELDERPARSEIHTVNSGPLVLPMALNPAPGNVLTVLFQGAVDRARMRLPIFLRWRYQNELQAGPTLAIADPTLDLSGAMRLGWYLGTESVDLATRVSGAVKRVARALGVSQLVLVGSSGGGFAALQVGAHLPGSIVVAMSPQTDLRRYSQRLVNAAITPALGITRLKESAIPTRRISVMDRIASLGTYPRVELISNPGDTYHVRHHESPLQEAFAAAGAKHLITTTNVDLGPGHRSLGNEQYGDVMRRVYQSI